MKICYVPKKFSVKRLLVIEQANDIIEEYRADGFDVTLRQLYYQFVQKGLLPNTQRSYDKLGATINDARLAGLVDWNSIVDRTRNLRGNTHWKTPEDIMRGAANSYKLDKWENQPNRVEVWIEKDALVGVLASCCPNLDVDYFSCRGYTSQSEVWSAAMRLIEYGNAGQEIHIIHLGDHDPSGIDMTRDIQNRMWTFGCRAKVNRVALNMPQVEEHNPPPNPAKMSDSRYRSYMLEYGDESWELDALEPQMLIDIIRDAVIELRDESLWDEMVEQEEEERSVLQRIADNYDVARDAVEEVN